MRPKRKKSDKIRRVPPAGICYIKEKNTGDFMAYEKRVCVMKQVKKGFTADGGALSGAVYAERTGETLKITPRLLGLAPVRDGRYVLIVRASGQTFCLDFSEGVIDEFQAPSIKEGFCALLCYVRAGGAEAVAFGACGK